MAAMCCCKPNHTQPGLVDATVSARDRVYLLGFCVQDTSFEAWRTSDWKTISQLNELLGAITADANVTPHLRSSNPDIEAALRVGKKDAFLVIVSHEPKTPETQVTVDGDIGL